MSLLHYPWAMRWEYLDPSNPSEFEHRAKVLQAIDCWWDAFAARADDIFPQTFQKREPDLAAWMKDTLQAIDGSLMWEYGPAVSGPGHRLVITPECEVGLRPLVSAILKRAPHKDGWEFYGHRLPEDVEVARQKVQSRCNATPINFECRVSRDDLHRVILTFEAAGVDDDDDAALRQAAVLGESLLGEEVLYKWIGRIEVKPFEEGSPVVPLGQLRHEVAKTIASISDGLPNEPWHARIDNASWSLFELDPGQASDYPRQSDLYVAKTPDIALWKATRGPFCDERFSKCGEVFCYVKIDGSQGLDTEKFADKASIEDALDRVLIPQGLGCQIGGGTGRRYSYIELALTDERRGIAEVIRRLRQGNIPRRTWILFHNAEKHREWVGMYPDTPPPPE